MIEVYKRNNCFVEFDWHHGRPHLHHNEKTSCEHKDSCIFIGVGFNGILEMEGVGGGAAFELTN